MLVKHANFVPHAGRVALEKGAVAFHPRKGHYYCWYLAKISRRRK